MNETIIKEIATNLNISDKQVSVVLNLLSDGNTIPFIARYRKEVTGALDEETIRSINEVYEYQVNLLKRKEDVIRLIDAYKAIPYYLNTVSEFHKIFNNGLLTGYLLSIIGVFTSYSLQRQNANTYEIRKIGEK